MQIQVHLKNPVCRNKSSSTCSAIRFSYTTEITQSALFSDPSLAIEIINKVLQVQTIESNVFYHLRPLLTFKNRASYIQDGHTATLQM